MYIELGIINHINPTVLHTLPVNYKHFEDATPFQQLVPALIYLIIIICPGNYYVVKNLLEFLGGFLELCKPVQWFLEQCN